MLLGWVWASRTGLEGFRDGMKQTMFGPHIITFWLILPPKRGSKNLAFWVTLTTKNLKNSDGVGSKFMPLILQGFWRDFRVFFLMIFKCFFVLMLLQFFLVCSAESCFFFAFRGPQTTAIHQPTNKQDIQSKAKQSKAKQSKAKQGCAKSNVSEDYLFRAFAMGN